MRIMVFEKSPWLMRLLDLKKVSLTNTARPQDTRILVPEKNRAAQNRAS